MTGKEQTCFSVDRYFVYQHKTCTTMKQKHASNYEMQYIQIIINLELTMKKSVATSLNEKNTRDYIQNFRELFEKGETSYAQYDQRKIKHPSLCSKSKEK